MNQPITGKSAKKKAISPRQAQPMWPMEDADEYLDLSDVTDEQLMEACAASNVACVNLKEHPASRKCLERGLHELGYVSVLYAKYSESRPYRLMKA